MEAGYLIKHPEDLLEVVNSLLLSLSLDHQLHKLSEVHGAGAVSVSVVDQLLELLLGGIVPQRPHHGPQLLGGDRSVAVLVEHHEGLLKAIQLLVSDLD